MLGSPPSDVTALPTFSFPDDVAASRPDDTDFLPAWSRGLSASPRLTATALPVHGGEAGGLELFGAGSLSTGGSFDVPAPELDVGTGTSPTLSPTHMVTSPPPLEARDPSGSLSGLMASGGGAFDSAFKQFQPTSAPADKVAIRPSPTIRSLSLDSPAPLSFANVASLTSAASPHLTPGEHGASASAPPPSISIRSPGAPSPRSGQGTASFAEGLPSGLQRRATDGTGVIGQDSTRIQAYAKLEFPSFDIYIQKLSVTIGRRPAAAAPPPPTALDTSSQLADYILGLSAPQVKQEETLPLPHAGLKSSLKGKEKAVDDTLADFLRATPPPTSSITAPVEISLADSLLSSTSASVPSRPVPSTSAPSVKTATAPTTPVEPAPPITDVDLGPIRAVSRQHAKLYFDHEAGSWAIEVLGRNGVVVEGKWRAKGQKVALVKKTKIQIAERIFHFVLPSVDVVEGERAPGKKVKTKVKTKVSGKGKGKMKTRSSGNGSSSLSEASGSDVELSPGLVKPTTTSKAGSTTPGPPPPNSVALPFLPPLPALTGAASASPSVDRSPSLSGAPSPAPTPLPDLLALSSTAPITRGALKPKPPPPAPKNQRPPPLPEPDVPDELTLELGRQRAAVIHQILTGQMSAATGRSALVKAAAAAATQQRRSGGKGMGSARTAPGKGLGKGKGLPARPRRPSHDAWLDEDDEQEDEDDGESSSSSSDDSDDSVMDLDDIGVGGKFLRKTPAKTPVSAQPTPAASPGLTAAPSPAMSSSTNPSNAASTAVPPPVPAAHSPAPPALGQPQQPFVAKKAPAKQPKQRQNSIGAATGVQPAREASLSSAIASPLGIALPALPALPSVLPTLPSLTVHTTSGALSPSLSATSSPRTASAPKLPTTYSLPSLPPSARPSPAPSAATLPSTASAAIPSSATSSIQLPGKKPKAPKKAPKAAPASAASPSLDGSPSGSTAPLPGAAKAPRPPPYTPAALPAGAVPPDAASAADPLAKPPYAYASLIAQAIQSSEDRRMTLHGVYEWILEKWPYFRENQAGWQSSVRHNLTPARGFLKVPRRDDEPGKGSFWQLDPHQMANFDGHHYRVKKLASPAPGAAPALAPAPGAAKPGSPAKPSPSPARSAGSGGSRTASNPALAKPLPIVVAPIPESYVRPAPTPSASSTAPTAAGTEDLTATLVKDPPIVLHEGQLLLNPAIFAHLPAQELERLQKLPAAQALQILQAEVVSHFKEKMRRAQQEKARREGKGGKGKKGVHKNPAGKQASASPAPTGSPAPSPSATLPKPATPSSSLPPLPSTTPGGTKRGREPDIDLTASTSGKAPPAKVSRTAAGGKKR